MRFDEFFKIAAGSAPFPFQRRFAESTNIPRIVHVPTGLGKTAMAVVGWLWRRFAAGSEWKATTPRRLAYCLPMRVLVEQTAASARKWTGHLASTGVLRGHVPSVHVLMGGEDEEDWDIYPEREAMLIGTQDMLLSRALNRGYAAARSRWPMHFGLLNTDCLWVFDEIQLMGSGLATTAQLEALRRLLPSGEAEGTMRGHGCLTVWMSATMNPNWLKTVDHDPVRLGEPLSLGPDDFQNDEVHRRWNASKPIGRARADLGDLGGMAREVLETHKSGTRTIVVVNTVRRACDLFDELNRTIAGSKRSGKNRRSKGPEAIAAASRQRPRLVLLHSRFRPADRSNKVKEALAPIAPGEPGTIVVSTQVIEAGVDVSAATLFTDLAPWASLVQRFGRCNRRGDENELAEVRWFGMAPSSSGDAGKAAAPYKPDDLTTSAGYLEKLKDVGQKSLPDVDLPFEHTQVIRRKDLVELFDTTPDLAGNDLDIDRFVREIEDSAVRVFWRDHGETPNASEGREALAAPRREELCSAPIGEFRDFARKKRGKVWRWSFLDQEWEQVDPRAIVPGQVFLVHAGAGGYTEDQGWNADSDSRVEPIEPKDNAKTDEPDGTEGEVLSQIEVWQTIAQHAQEVWVTLGEITAELPLAKDLKEALLHAARWHDRGKAHEVFQDAIHDGQPMERGHETTRRRERPRAWQGCRFVAKAPGRRKRGDGSTLDQGFWRWPRPYKRRHFRHELASALAVLDPRNNRIPETLRDLVAYLVAAHHGKVRLSIRSLPGESRPGDGRRFARGVWDGDELPLTDLGGGVEAPPVALSLDPMELGLCEEPPFAGLPSWAERMLRLRDALGPFRLAHLEAVLRAADMRASRMAGRNVDGGRSR